MIIIADSHISSGTYDEKIFFRMLKSFEKNNEDIVFLGDIFDLWIALPRYEEKIHKKFLLWCKKEKKRRNIGFIEGNHEYFVAWERSAYFSWCSDRNWKTFEGGLVFCHGDMINTEDKNYLFMRKSLKNKFTKKLISFLPYGPEIADIAKEGLKKTNSGYRKYIPMNKVICFAKARLNENNKIVFAGHFHEKYTLEFDGGKRFVAVAPWCKDYEVAFYEPLSGNITYQKMPAQQTNIR